MARLSPHTDNRPNNVIGIHNDKSQRDLSKDDSSSKVTYPSAATRFFKKGKLVPQQKSTTAPSSQLPTIGEHIEFQWEWEWEEDYGYLTGEEKKMITISMHDDDDDDDFIGDDYKNSKGCGTQAVDTCAFVSQPLVHFLRYFLC